MTLARRIGAVFTAALALLSQGCANPFPALWPEGAPPASSAQDAKSATEAAEPEVYVIGVPDVLSVRVWKHPDLSIEAPVRRDGQISIPLLDDVQAAGETPESLAKLIQERLSSYVSRPNVTVIVLSPDSQTVTVVGAVNQSGAVPLRRDMGVLEAVALAGGFTPWANKSEVTVIRTIGGKRVALRFDYRAYVSAEPDSDISLRPGDVVYVPE